MRVSPGRVLRKLLEQKRTLVKPGAYNALLWLFKSTRSQRRMTRLATSVLAAALTASFPLAAADLKVLWSQTIPGGNMPAGVFTLSDASFGSDGPITALGQLGTQPAMARLDENGMGDVIELGNRGHAWLVAQRNGGGFWIGGRINQRAYVPGGDIADAYLGRFDERGALVSEHAYRTGVLGNWRMVEALLPLPSGGIAVAGRNSPTNWMARINDEGKLAWERRFGVGNGVALATIGDRIAVATFDRPGEKDSRTGQQEVVVIIFDRNGKELSRQKLRSLSQQSHAGNGSLTMAASGNAFYVVSGWHEFSTPTQLMVSRLSSDGAVSWHRDLPGSIVKGRNNRTMLCKYGEMVLQSGDLLVACAAGPQILLYQMDAVTGAATERTIRLPDCHEGRTAALFLRQRRDGEIWMLGTRPTNNVGAGCTWLGKLSLQ